MAPKEDHYVSQSQTERKNTVLENHLKKPPDDLGPLNNNGLIRSFMCEKIFKFTSFQAYLAECTLINAIILISI